MSSVVKIGEGGGDTMWRCENDILKDLAFLNDFGGAEPHKILYSNGRGTKIKRKETSPEKFVDPRTGEIIDVNDLEFGYYDNLHKGKGRGRHFGNFSKKQFQLREQLRLARPLGSGDEPIESFCRRFKSEVPNTGDGTSTSDSDADSQTARIRSEVTKPSARKIGLRNSLLQSNVLINGLLSKTGDNSNESEAVTNGENLNSFTEDDDDDDDDDDNSLNSQSDINSNVSTLSGSIFSANDFPPLHTRSKTQS